MHLIRSSATTWSRESCGLLDGIAEALAKKRYLISDDFKRIKADCAA